MTYLTENTLEQTALAWFESLGYAVEFGPAISPDELGAERRASGVGPTQLIEY